MSTPRAKDIFLDAIDLPAGQQEPFIRGQCQNDDELRRQVEGLLRMHYSKPGVLNRPAAELETTWSGPDAVTLGGASVLPRRSEQPGDVIDRYRLIRLLGEGGFGSVFLAQQTEPLVRDVALKVIRRGMDTDQIIARFELERQSLAMMDHPGIARVLDAGATASGRPYFVMEFVDGVPITHYCAQHKLSIAQRLELIEQACLAVQHAHQKGIIHRDLKPGNILVSEVDGRAIPKIIDFGVAKATESAFNGSRSGTAAPMTLEAQIIGTPQYMSPEQAAGGASQIDTRTDVYSLGTVLYQLITGAPPFDPESLRGAGISELVRIIRDQTPPKPSARTADVTRTRAVTSSLLPLRRRRADEIDWIVMKAMEKEPARRYQTPAELAADIRRHLSDQTVLAGRPSRLYSLGKFARRHRVPLAAAAAVAVTLVAATITSAVLAARARRAEADARQQALRAEEELARAQAIVSFTDDLLGGIAPAVARGRDTTLMRELLDSSIQKADANLADQPTIDLSVRHTIGSALNDLGDPAAAIAQLHRIYDATAAPATRDHPTRLRLAITLAQIHLQRFDVAQAEPIVNETLAAYRRSGRDDSDEAWTARLAEAGVFLRKGDSAEAEKRFAQVLEHYRSLGQGESTTAILAWNNLAQSLVDQGRLAEATDQWCQLNAVDRRKYGEKHPYTLMTLMNIASALHRQQKLDESEQAFRQAMATARQIFEPGHPTLLINKSNLASLLMQRDRLDDADVILAEALETGRRKLGPMDMPMDVLVLQLSQLRAKQGRFDEAVKFAHEFYGAVQSKYGQRSVRSLSAVVLVYDSLIQANRPAEGVALWEQIGDLPAEVPADLRHRLHACAGRLYLAHGNEAAARRHADLARQAAPIDSDGKPRITPSLRLLEAQLNITPASPATSASR
jgi:serine/threonine protein kinase/tetratricopeptide (TPR) repeat protein